MHNRQVSHLFQVQLAAHNRRGDRIFSCDYLLRRRGAKNTAGVKHRDKVERYQMHCGITGMSGTLRHTHTHTHTYVQPAGITEASVLKITPNMSLALNK